MSDNKDRSRSNAEYFSSTTEDDGEEVLVLDYAGPRWELVDHRPERKRRARGVDPYNTVEQAPRMQAWLRLERR